jgi:hypothetical protein
MNGVATGVTTELKSFTLIRNRYPERELGPALTTFAGCWVRAEICNYFVEVKSELLAKATVSTSLCTYLICTWVLKILSVRCSNILK